MSEASLSIFPPMYRNGKCGNESVWRREIKSNPTVQVRGYCVFLVDQNTFYTHQDVNVYEYCFNEKMETMNAMVCFILEDNWNVPIIRMIFPSVPFVLKSYRSFYL